nr:MAG TPA: hypothetical protein [Microviridae sp.]
MYSESTHFVQKPMLMNKKIFKPDYPFIDSHYLGALNKKTSEKMEQYYFFFIRYYNRSLKGRRRYFRMQSCYFHLLSFCELEMRDKMFELSKDYEIDGYSIQSIWLDPNAVISGKIEVREF